MSQPALKIKLRLNGPSPAKSDKGTSSPSSSNSASTSSSPAPTKQTLEDDTGSPSKKPKVSRGGRRSALATKPKETTDDDGTGVDDSQPATPARGPSSRLHHASSKARKDILKYKDVKARRWKHTPLTFYTLDGGEIQLSSWRSDESMALNKRKTEPVTVAEIDQLFSAASGERDFRPFLCTHHGCSKSFTSYDQLQTHETNMHGAKKLVCGIDGCHKSFVTPGQLTKHRKMVHFRAARKAKLQAAAAAAAAAEEASTPATPTGTNNAPTPTNDEDANVDISED
ncbi:hypothetical protein RO3G_14962 [Lichtheimia corymbifera JMRC:FSU:9682]|uniref:C2H2-type domain-containing protein n=1 Tax=Lichtheimia corymbifera JMRC:FSU:9682 TaxID=1263082 RepID=A0A068S306_9FUNG|nr:hypothetical protein RO3G_14962 [Lichtheimia corymbifera JMRC:FSU:9682]